MMIRIILGVLIIAAIIDGGVFLSDYFNKSFAVDALNSQIENGNQNLAVISGKTSELNAQIAENSARADKVMTAIADKSSQLPDKEVSSNEIVKALLNLGQKNGVSIIPLTTQDWSNVTTKDYDYRVLRISLEIMGTKDNIVQTVRQLPELNDTLVIENLVVSRTKDPSQDAKATPVISTSAADQFSANLTMALYCR